MTDIDPDIPSPREKELEQAADKLARAMMTDDPVAAIEAVKAKEATRAADMIKRDRENADREASRQAAIIQVADGLTVNIGNTVVEPTPEWLAKGESRVVAVGGERWTDQPLSTRRRVLTSYAMRAYNSGKITARQYKACAWYRDRHELSGLEGNVKSVTYQPKIIGGVNGGIMFTEAQLEAIEDLRNARLLIPSKLRKFFDIFLIDNIPLARAARAAYAGRHPLDSLRCCADRVGDYIEYVSRKSL